MRVLIPQLVILLHVVSLDFHIPSFLGGSHDAGLIDRDPRSDLDRSNQESACGEACFY